MKERLIAGVMGQDCMKFLPMCLESLKDADKIIYIDGGSKDNSIEYAKSQGAEIIENHYDQDDPKMNGRQRNIFLNYVKEKYPNWWCLAIDADEVVEDLNKIKKFINNPNCLNGLYNVHMRHFIGNLGHEDATQKEHLVLRRLFKISSAEKYPEVEHSVLEGPYMGDFKETTIWHLSYIPNMWEIKKKYENHLKKSNIHTPFYLKEWYWRHLFGHYPNKPINLIEIPKIILNEFNIDKDEIYFSNRGLEPKHFIDAINWKEFFKCENAIEFGCGLGPRVYAMNLIGIETKGIEISNYAVQNSLIPDNIKKGDITQYTSKEIYDLVIAYDILEHLNYKDLDKSIDNLILLMKNYLLVSIPFKGTPNCENDPTHIIKEDKKWWVKKFEDKELKLIKTPDKFLFKEQILIFKK
ncbi:MAG: hypothetical protein ACTSUC_09960 [Promethearchaeota archaeon]